MVMSSELRERRKLALMTAVNIAIHQPGVSFGCTPSQPTKTATAMILDDADKIYAWLNGSAKPEEVPAGKASNEDFDSAREASWAMINAKYVDLRELTEWAMQTVQQIVASAMNATNTSAAFGFTGSAETKIAPPCDNTHVTEGCEKFYPPHQQRVFNEKADLDERLTKLRNFGNTSTFSNLGLDERNRLVRQVTHMTEYSKILGERLAAF